ncbi:unnamed protein product [Malassezia sympodialis ATCC 42132]|uniref:uncharacterized protein n=1 Tax=Malassezia sympodialis (strain ATCC 42132) TaxID=1230383 RepID=UPI0002C25F9C|nr:uncharacterized protein MSY001_0574 [Malassezia sympodialis ATCC 42132]CCU97868.1 unnamed protein product [Malassezia sympodialis ATCC 42132]|eukprot:XP_018739197.1 uncharacterized protein MSY001_0574 [Malassezia sympodialis ATCC 42132]
MLIIVFGENLPERFFERLYDFRRADLLLVMGTSLVVQPFASLIDEVSLSCPRALLNLEKVGERRRNFSFIHDADEGFDFDDAHSRDIFCQGKVDDTVRKLAQYCGWEDDLDKIYKNMNECMDREMGLKNRISVEEDKRSNSEMDPDLLADQLKAATLENTRNEKL